MATLAEERAKHSIIYKDNTSDIKDDVVQLIGCLKSNQGAMGRQTAAFLLWYHALEGGEEKVAEMASNNIINVCLTIMDSMDASPVDKNCTAGILTAICECEADEAEFCEQVIKGRSQTGGNAVVILHTLLDHGGDLAVVHAARVLRLVAEDPSGRSALLKILDQKLGQYCDMYCRFLFRCRDHTCVQNVCAFLAALLHERLDLKGEAIAGGLVEAVFDSVRSHKAEQTICMAMRCMEELASERESWPRIVKSNGISILVDVLGPPPAAVLKHEMANWRHLIDPAYAAKRDKNGTGDSGGREGKKEVTKGIAAGSPGVSAGAAAAQVKPGAGGNNPSTRKSGLPLMSGPERRLLEKLEIGEAPVDKDKPDPDPKTLLSINSCGLKWHGTVTLATLSAAAGCLYEMCHKDDLMHAISRRSAASRLVPLLSQCMRDSGGDGGKKKGKKKGLTLTPEQTEALVRITGCLKFLTMVNTNCYRVAQLGAAKPLKPIYEECGHTLLRRNAQAVLSNIAMLAENGQALLDNKLPEEFLVEVPMRLTQEEKQQLSIEFPEATFKDRVESKAPPSPAPEANTSAAPPRSPPKSPPRSPQNEEVLPERTDPQE